MAAMAASLMCRGVGKWGSPAPKSTRFAPWARSLAASAATAMVAETSIRPMRSAKILEGAATVVVIALIFADFGGMGKPRFSPAGTAGWVGSCLNALRHFEVDL